VDDYRMCLDVVLPPELQARARELAVAENPANAPRRVSPFEIAADVRFLWKPGTTLKVRFLGGTPVMRARVEQYARVWEQYANIRFDFVDDGDAPIRVAFMRGKGSWSYLGTQALVIEDQQKPTMNYGWLTDQSEEQDVARVVLHEFGHALGCIHEHQHPEQGIPWDKEKAYAYYGQNGWTRADVDEQVFKRYDASFIRGSAFDRDSIMMYPVPEEITIGRFSVGWNRALSAADKLAIAELYPFD
jgi:hypothetical protein